MNGKAGGRNARVSWSDLNHRGCLRIVATYKPGETVPKDGTVQCTQANGTKDQVKANTKFAPCDHWGQHNGKDCTWEYV